MQPTLTSKNGQKFLWFGQQKKNSDKKEKPQLVLSN